MRLVGAGGRKDDVMLIAHLSHLSSRHARTLGGVAKEWESVYGPGLPGAKRFLYERVPNSHYACIEPKYIF
jgi:hypothetical protein